MAFPPGFLDELRARLTTSDVVGRKVSLKRKNASEFVGLCPFHNEKTPSFTVSDKKGFFYCFGCQEKGSAIDFVMKTEGLAFPEAVEKLAREVGLPVPRATPQERERAERAATLQQVVELGALWFQKQLRLPVGRQGLDYLRGRGLEEAVIDDFRLGFAPDSRDGLLAALKKDGVPLDKIVEAGLAIQPEEEGRPAYDRFRGRVMFTINDRRGRAIAFGGRVMGQGEPKYLNSPETPLFHKGANLYCLDRARAAVTKNQPVIVAEGYMDVIALHGAGFTGAVAPLGTALTESQMAELWKLAPEPYLCFDGDNAGRRAAQRAADKALPLLQPGKSLRFVALPAGEDPDSLIRHRGAQAVEKVLELARPLADVIWELEVEGRPVDTPERRAGVRKELRQRVAAIADREVRELYESEMQGRMDALWRPAKGPRDEVSGQPWRGGKRSFRRDAGPQAPFVAGLAARRSQGEDGSAPQVRGLLGALIERPALLHTLAEEVSQLPITDPELQRLRRALLDGLAVPTDGAPDGAPDGATGDAIDQPLEQTLLLDHLQQSGLGRTAEIARAKARSDFRRADKVPDGWLGQWRRTASHLAEQVARPEEVREAREALDRDPSDENLQRVADIAARQLKETEDA